MKTRGWLVAAILLYGVEPISLKAQCGGTIRTVSYDTTVTGTGETNGSPFTFTFPLFDGGLGTLMNVNVASVVTLSYSYEVENNDATNTKSFRLRPNRYDNITSAGLLADLEYYRDFPSPPQYLPTNNLAVSDGVAGAGPDYAYVAPFNLLTQDTIINETLSNTADFIGAGDISFAYSTIMGANATGNTNTQLNSIVEDEINFRITYTYCDNIMLGGQRDRVQRERSMEEIKNRISPNPSNTGNFKIRFDNKARGDWQVEIYSTSGQLVNRKLFYNSLDAVVHNDRNLQPGVYIVKAINLKSYTTFVERLAVK